MMANVCRSVSSKVARQFSGKPFRGPPRCALTNGRASPVGEKSRCNPCGVCGSIRCSPGDGLASRASSSGEARAGISNSAASVRVYFMAAKTSSRGAWMMSLSEEPRGIGCPPWCRTAEARRRAFGFPPRPHSQGTLRPKDFATGTPLRDAIRFRQTLLCRS